MRFVVDDLALGQVFLLAFCIPLTITFHQCFTLIFIHVLLLPEGQTGEALEHSSSQSSFGSPGPLDRKVFSLCFYLYISIQILYIYIYIYILYICVYIYIHIYIYIYIYKTCVYRPSFPRICPLFRPKNFCPVMSLKFAKMSGFFGLFLIS